MHQILEVLEITVHPDKRFIGKTIRGFDFLSIQFQQGRKLRPSKEFITGYVLIFVGFFAEC